MKTKLKFNDVWITDIFKDSDSNIVLFQDLDFDLLLSIRIDDKTKIKSISLLDSNDLNFQTRAI